MVSNRLLLTAIAAAALGAPLVATDALAANYCAGVQEEVTCADGITRRPGDILFSVVRTEYDAQWNGVNKVRIYGVRPDSNAASPTYYLHSEFQVGNFGDMVAIPGNPEELAFVATLPQTNGRPTVGKIDRCGKVTHTAFGDLSPYYNSTWSIDSNALAVNPKNGDLFVPAAIDHPSLPPDAPPGEPRPFSHLHFRIPSAGGIANYFWAGGEDAYGPGDSKHTGGAIFDPSGNLWQSGFGQESLSVILNGYLSQEFPEEIRVDYNPEAHNAPGYYGLNDMVMSADGTFIISPDLTNTITRVDVTTLERKALWKDGRSYQYVTVDQSNRVWAVARTGELLRFGVMNRDNLGTPATFNLSALATGGSVRSIATYGVSGPEVRSSCQAPVSCSMGATTASYGGYGIHDIAAVNNSPFSVKGWKVAVDFGTATPRVGWISGANVAVSGNKLIVSGNDTLAPGQRKNFWLGGNYTGPQQVRLSCK